MKIKQRLTVQFMAVVAVLLLVFTVLIFYFSSKNRTDAFNLRLKNNAVTIARLFVNVHKVDSTLLLQINKNTVNFLAKEHISIFDTTLRTLYSFHKDSLEDIHSSVDLRRIIEHGEIIEEKGEFKIIGFMYPENNPDLIVVVSAKDEFSQAELSRLKEILGYGFFISILIVFITGYFYSIQALKPISEIIKQVKKINSSRLYKRVYTLNKNDEIGELANNFNHMLDRLEESFEIQKNYVANISHEMRTPLTAMHGEIDVALMNDYTKEEYRQSLKSIQGEILYLVTLTNGFLELAEASIDDSSVDLVQLRIDDLLYEVKEEVIKRNPDNEIEINFLSGINDDESLTIYGKKHLIKVMLRNIIDNGLKYSDDKKVSISIDAVEYFLQIEIRDKGCGIPAEDLQKIMRPFYRSNNAKNQRGYGLGLYIANKVVKLHNGEISIESFTDYGTNVKILLPFKLDALT